jgi:hypothetical protein
MSGVLRQNARYVIFFCKAGALLFVRRRLETTQSGGRGIAVRQFRGLILSYRCAMGLEWKARRKRMGASEDLERKARFLARSAKKAPKRWKF